MENAHWLWIKFTDLYWWQKTLWVVYTFYFIARSWHFWDETGCHGIGNGYKKVIFGHERIFRVYHIVRILFDIPPAIIGLTFPFLRKVLAYKVYEFKDKKTESK